MAKPSQRSSSTKPGFRSWLSQVNELCPRIRDGSFSGLILLQGPGEYLGLKSIAAMKNQVDVHQSLEAPAIPATDFETLWSSTSLFEPRTLYLLRRVEKRTDFWKLLTGIEKGAAIRNPLCLVHTGKAPGIRLKKELDRLKAMVIQCPIPAPGESAEVIAVFCRSAGVRLTADASRLLAEQIGPDPYLLDNEIKKLALIADAGQELDAKTIRPWVGALREDHAFTLDNYLIQGEGGHVQALITDLLRRGEKPIALLGILALHCRKALGIAAGLQKGMSTRELASSLRLPFRVAGSYNQYVQKQGHGKFRRILSLCHEADIRLKTSGADDEMVLNHILNELLTPAG